MPLSIKKEMKTTKRPKQALRAQLKVGALEDAGRTIVAMEADDIPKPALKDFVAKCLNQREPEPLKQLLRTAGIEIRLHVEDLFARSIRNLAPSMLLDTRDLIAELVELFEHPRVVFRIAGTFYLRGLDAEASVALRRVKKLLATGGDVSLTQKRSANPNISKQEDFRNEQIMDWLNISHDQRPAWLAQRALGMEEHTKSKLLLVADPEYLAKFRTSLSPADLGPLSAIANQKKPAVIATVHAGVLMGTLQHLVTQKIPVHIIAGNPVIPQLVAGGDLYDLESTGKSPLLTARRVIHHLRSNHIVGLMADGLKGYELHPVIHRDFVFELPDSIPQLAFRYKANVIWLATFWRENRMVCECFHAPSPLEHDTFESYRDRWLLFVMNEIYKIYSADPRNALSKTPITPRIIG